MVDFGGFLLIDKQKHITCSKDDVASIIFPRILEWPILCDPAEFFFLFFLRREKKKRFRSCNVIYVIFFMCLNQICINLYNSVNG